MFRTKHILPVLLFAGLLFKGCEKEAEGEYLMDIDGNNYPIVQIGSMKWMAENLKVTRDKDGNPLDTYCYMDKDSKCEEFGQLYPWKDALKASPAGWRLPHRRNGKGWKLSLGWTRMRLGNMDGEAPTRGHN